MSFPPEHEMHQRRRGRNIAVGLLLGALIAIIFGLTYVKITSEGFRESAVEAEQ